MLFTWAKRGIVMPILSDDAIEMWVAQHIATAESTGDTFSENPIKSGFWSSVTDPDRRTYPGPTGTRYPHFAPSSRIPNGMATSEMQGVYFYYFGFDEDNAIFCRIFFTKDLDDGSIPRDRIGDWIAMSRALGSGGSPSMADGFIGWNPNIISWATPSFLVFFMDSDKWRWIDSNIDGITRNVSIHFPSITKGKNNNNSFFNSRTEILSLGDKNLKILVLENHHLSWGSPDRARVTGDGDDVYKFDLYFSIKLDAQPGSSSNLIMVIDPSGRNTGP